MKNVIARKNKNKDILNLNEYYVIDSNLIINVINIYFLFINIIKKYNKLSYNINLITNFLLLITFIIFF